MRPAVSPTALNRLMKKRPSVSRALHVDAAGKADHRPDAIDLPDREKEQQKAAERPAGHQVLVGLEHVLALRSEEGDDERGHDDRGEYYERHPASPASSVASSSANWALSKKNQLTARHTDVRTNHKKIQKYTTGIPRTSALDPRARRRTG